MLAWPDAVDQAPPPGRLAGPPPPRAALGGPLAAPDRRRRQGAEVDGGASGPAGNGIASPAHGERRRERVGMPGLRPVGGRSRRGSGRQGPGADGARLPSREGRDRVRRERAGVRGRGGGGPKSVAVRRLEILTAPAGAPLLRASLRTWSRAGSLFPGQRLQWRAGGGVYLLQQMLSQRDELQSTNRFVKVVVLVRYRVANTNHATRENLHVTELLVPLGFRFQRIQFNSRRRQTERVLY